MADMSVSGVNEAMGELNILGDAERFFDMLVAGAIVVERALSQAALAHVSSGAMSKSIRADKSVKEDKNGRHYITIYPRGEDENGVRNAAKAAWLNYGTSRQPGDGWYDAAEMVCEAEVDAAMSKALEERAEKKQNNTTQTGGPIYA